MSMNITFICGSPRQFGNTNRIVGIVGDYLKSKGNNITIIDASKLNYKVKGCICCMGCQKSEKYECVIEDEAAPLIAGLSNADVIVFATPVYWHGPSAQLKMFMDRMFSLIKIGANSVMSNAFKQNVKCALISTAGGDYESGLLATKNTFKEIAESMGIELIHFLLPFAHTPEKNPDTNTELKKEIIKFADKLAE